MSAYMPVRFIPTDTDLICFGEMGLRKQVQCLGPSEGSFSLARAVMSQLPDLEPHRMNQPLKPQTIHSNHIWCHFLTVFL